MWACFIVPSQSFHMKRLSLWRVRALFVYWCTGWDGITSMMAEALDRMLHLQRSDECCACPTSPLPMCLPCAGVSSLPDCHHLSSKAVVTCHQGCHITSLGQKAKAVSHHCLALPRTCKAQRVTYARLSSIASHLHSESYAITNPEA